MTCDGSVTIKLEPWRFRTMALQGRLWDRLWDRRCGRRCGRGCGDCDGLGRPLYLTPSATAGLAPMELVLWLPILLFMVALMLNYGTLATWRVRAEVVSRDAAWRKRWPRTGGEEGPPHRNVWPTDAVMTTEPDEPLGLLDVAEIDHPVVRGPLPAPFQVQPILDPTPGAYRGISEVNREYPMLPRMGDYNSGDVAGPLFDRKWQSATQGIPNNYRRTKVLYNLRPINPLELPPAFTNAVRSMRSSPHFCARGAGAGRGYPPLHRSLR